MNESLIKTLNECGVKKSQIEKDLGMPLNSLSGMLTGKKPIPLKWQLKLTEYVAKNNIQKVNITGIQATTKTYPNFEMKPLEEMGSEMNGIALPDTTGTTSTRRWSRPTAASSPAANGSAPALASARRFRPARLPFPDMSVLLRQVPA